MFTPKIGEDEPNLRGWFNHQPDKLNFHRQGIARRLYGDEVVAWAMKKKELTVSGQHKTGTRWSKKSKVM